MGPSLWDERGEEGADEGPRGGKEAWLRESSGSSLVLVLGAPASFLTAFFVLHPFIHQTFLGHRCEETVMVTETMMIYSDNNLIITVVLDHYALVCFSAGNLQNRILIKFDGSASNYGSSYSFHRLLTLFDWTFQHIQTFTNTDVQQPSMADP